MYKNPLNFQLERLGVKTLSLNLSMNGQQQFFDALKPDKNCYLSQFLLKLEIFGGQMPKILSLKHDVRMRERRRKALKNFLSRSLDKNPL